MIKKLLFLFTLLISTLISCANNQSEEPIKDSELKNIISNFFKKYENSPEAAIDYICSTNKTFTPEQTSDLKNKLLAIQSKIGKFQEIEQITSKQTSKSLILYSYLVKHEIQPLRVTFIFYKPNKQWILYKFKFDDDFDKELEESGRIYFIK